MVKLLECTACAEIESCNIGLCADEGGEECAAWIMDSGSSTHVTPHEHDFSDYIKLSEARSISGVNGEVLQAEGIGKVALSFQDVEGVEGTITFSNVLHVPGSKYRLLSVPQLLKKNVEVVFGSDALLRIPSGPIVKLERHFNLFKFPDPKHVSLMVKEASLSRWHARLGHRNVASIKKISHDGVVKGLVISKDEGNADGPCSTCQEANMRKVVAGEFDTTMRAAKTHLAAVMT